MAKDEKIDQENEELNIDLGIETLGLGLAGLLNVIGNLVDLAAEFKELGDEINKVGKIDISHPNKSMKRVFGVSVKTAVGCKPVIKPFGNFKKTPEGSKIEEGREPISDVFDEDEEIRIYAEIPGVSQEDIKLDLKEDSLEILAHAKDRKYHKEILLPAKVKAETMTSSYYNGILEVKVKK